MTSKLNRGFGSVLLLCLLIINVELIGWWIFETTRPESRYVPCGIMGVGEYPCRVTIVRK